MEIITSNTVSIIIAIEDYQFSRGRIGINSVIYAKNDAMAFKQLLVNEFNVDDNQIKICLDEEATKSWLENELPYTIGNLSKDDKFVFYYAGHGFYQDSTNRLTAWDSHPFNLQGTTVSLRDVLLDPLDQSNCEQSLIFIDACARELPDTIRERDIISNMDETEFEAFIQSSSFRAAYFSCSPGEKSYPSKALKHGIWTWHLIEALSGNSIDAIVREYYITDTSLRDYLRQAVPTFIRRKTKIRGRQTPYAMLSSSNTFEIRMIPKKDEFHPIEPPKIKMRYERAYLRNMETDFISKLNDFDKSKRHFVPSDVNDAADSFVKRLLENEVSQEIKNVYDNAKSMLKLKRRNIEKYIGYGGGSVDTEYFRYKIDVGQNPEDCAEALTIRKLIIRVNLTKLPEDFDAIFPAYLDEIVIPISGSIDFDDLVDSFENLEEVSGGRLKEDDESGEIQYLTSDSSIAIRINTYDKELSIRPKGKHGCLDLIRKSESGLKEIFGQERNLLNS